METKSTDTQIYWYRLNIVAPNCTLVSALTKIDYIENAYPNIECIRIKLMKNIFLLLAVLLSCNLIARTQEQILKALNSSAHDLDKDADYSYIVNASSIKYDISGAVNVIKSYNKTIKI